MSQSPNPNPPPKGGAAETLEDAVYSTSLAEGHSGLKRVNPLIAIPATIVGYALFGSAIMFALTQTEAGKQAIKKTVGIDLMEELEEEDAPPPPPPPPPPPAARPAAPKVEMKVDAPPPPPLTDQEVVPDIAPKELPKQDLSMAYQPQGSGEGSGSGTGMGVGTGVGTGMGAGAGAGAGASSTKVVDFDFTQLQIKYRPPAPPYPPLARIAKISGTVVVEIVIGTDGVPTSATALEGPAQLRPSAEQYAMKWRFEPAMLNGVPTVARFRLSMPFTLR